MTSALSEEMRLPLAEADATEALMNESELLLDNYETAPLFEKGELTLRPWNAWSSGWEERKGARTKVRAEEWHQPFFYK